METKSIDGIGKGKLTNDGGLNHKVGVGTSASFNGGGKEYQGETVTTAKAGSIGSWNLAPETVAKLTAFSEELRSLTRLEGPLSSTHCWLAQAWLQW